MFLVAGVLGMRHASEVAHVRDPHSGDVVHAQELAERHEHGAAHHLHGTAAPDHHGVGACSLLAVVHAAPAARSVTLVARTAIVTPLVTLPTSAPRLAIAGYRLAPKTSPPARA